MRTNAAETLENIKMWVTILPLLLLAGLGCMSIIDGFFHISLSKPDWHCTASRVVKESLPREEECTQYTRKETKE